MLERVLGSLTGVIGAYLSKKIEENRDLYSEEQARILEAQRVLEEHYMNEEAGWFSSSASQTSSSSSSSSSSERENRKLGTPYFESLEKRLGIKDKEFFKKEDFDIE